MNPKSITPIALFLCLLLAGGLVWFVHERNQHGTALVPSPGNVQLPKPSEPPQAPRVEHVIVVLGENHSYEQVIGNTKDMPFLNSLAQRYASALNYYANTHPSIGNYFMLTAGKIITNEDKFSATVDQDNIVRELNAAGRTWREYSEGLTETGYTGQNRGGYTEHHNPLAYFSDVRDHPDQMKNLVPLSQFSEDIAVGTLPNYSLVIPTNIHNGHDCPSGRICPDSAKLQSFDQWLKDTLSPLLGSADFQNTLVIVTYDEAQSKDKAHGGGHIAWVAAGPQVKNGYTSNTFFQHEHTLRFTLELLGVSNFPGEANTAGSMREFLKEKS